MLKECEFDNRFATPEEQEILSQYVGWGGIPEAFDEKLCSVIVHMYRNMPYPSLLSCPDTSLHFVPDILIHFS